MSDLKLDQIPSHILWVELKTRISSQNLHLRSGLEETAAESIHTLFKTVRELMSGHPNAHQFQCLAEWFLNSLLRPYTARWHGWMTQDRTAGGENRQRALQFKDEWVRRQFRRELLVLQSQIGEFV